jgi:ATP-binding cassette, subfamily B, bacterial
MPLQLRLSRTNRVAALQRGRFATLRVLRDHLWPALRPYWPRQLEALAYILLETLWGITLPLATKYLVDTVIPARDTVGLATAIGVLLALYGLNAALGMRRAYVTASINEGLGVALEGRVYARLQQLGHAFYARARVGDLMARLTGDVEIIQTAVSQFGGLGIFLTLRAAAAAVTAFVLDPLLGSLLLIATPLFAVSYALLRARFHAASVELQQLCGETAAEAQEQLTGHSLIKAFGLQEHVVGRYQSFLQRRLEVSLRLTVIAGLFETSMILAVTLGQLVVLGVGGLLVIREQLSLGTLLAFVGLLPAFVQPIAMLSNLGQTLQRAAGAIVRIVEILEQPNPIHDSPTAVEAGPLAHGVRFEDVTFGYAAQEPVLKQINLFVPAGTHVSIVGASGCGKTTLANLLLRFFDPDGGRVLVDGRDIRDLILASLRGQIGYVPQDATVFNTTLRENILLGRLHASESELATVVRAARLEQYVAGLPAGLDTLIGERGVCMSGGERQRLALARALIRNPALLILDEATSALDVETEADILETLAAAARGRTILSITHRLALAATADRVVVLADGAVAEQGTHAELLRSGGIYSQLLREQAARLDAAATSPRSRALSLAAAD